MVMKNIILELDRLSYRKQTVLARYVGLNCSFYSYLGSCGLDMQGLLGRKLERWN